MLSQPKITLFCVYGRIEQVRVLSLKQTESDKTYTLDIFLSVILLYLGNRTSCRLPWLSLILILNSLKALSNSAHGVHSSMLSGAKLSSSGTESFPFPCHTLLIHLFVQLQLFVEPYPLLDQHLSAFMPLPTMILVY